ncbi:hypothetical protein Tco_0455969 [Tanacetum coccineum]
MAELKFVDQHNTVACLERNDGNAEFHQIVDFLSSSMINYALTAVVISESSVRNDLLFDDEDGITCLTNDDIFENLTLMGFSNTPEPQPTPSTSQPNVSQSQLEPLQIETSQIVTHAPQIEAPIEQILPSPSTSQRQPLKDPNTYRRTKRGRNTKVPQPDGSPKKVGDEAVYKGEDDRVVMVATTTSSLEAEQESGTINKTQPTATLNEPSLQGTGSGSGPWCQDTMGGMPAQTRSEGVPNLSSDPPLS